MTFCAVPEHALARAATGQCKWPRGHVITWTIVRKLDAFTDDEYLQIFQEVWAAWEQISGVRSEYRASGHANVLIGTRPIDRGGGILAEAELPCGNITAQTQLRQWYDTGEQWVNASNTAGAMIDLLRVGRHETGHTLGISHASPGIGALMEPRISSIRIPKEWDIRQAVQRYGDPSTTPPPGGGTACEGLIRTCLDDEDSVKTALKAWELLKRALAKNHASQNNNG